MSAHLLAATLVRFGGVDELALHHLPCRAPGRGDIEVRVEAASINPIDVRRRGGYGRKVFSLFGAARMPLALGNDLAGIVTAVGGGVSGLREGDAVFGAMPASSAGSHASHVAVRAEHAALQPAGMAAQTLAVLPYNFLTVSRSLADAGLDGNDVRGCEVLVHGASGALACSPCTCSISIAASSIRSRGTADGLGCRFDRRCRTTRPPCRAARDVLSFGFVAHSQALCRCTPTRHLFADAAGGSSTPAPQRRAIRRVRPGACCACGIW